MGGRDLVVRDHDGEALDDVHELADVARPGIVEERLSASRVHRLPLLPVFGREVLQEVFDEQGNVLRRARAGAGY